MRAFVHLLCFTLTAQQILFQGCKAESKRSYMCFLTTGINTPDSPVGFTPGSDNVDAKKTSLHAQESVENVGPNAEVQLQDTLDGLNKEQARLNRARYWFFVVSVLFFMILITSRLASIVPGIHFFVACVVARCEVKIVLEYILCLKQ